MVRLHESSSAALCHGREASSGDLEVVPSVRSLACQGRGLMDLRVPTMGHDAFKFEVFRLWSRILGADHFHPPCGNL